MTRALQMRSTRHLNAASLQALRDGDGALYLRLYARVHLLRCEKCAARAAAEREAADRTARLLALDLPHSPTPDAWQKVLDRPGALASGPARSRIRWATSAVLIAAGLAIVATWVGRRGHPDLVAQMYQLSSQDRYVPRRAAPRDVDFARSVTSLEAQGALRRISDVCCADRDGEGPADDGVLTVSLAGSRSPVVILYEDTQRRGHFDPGDAVLKVSRPGPSAADATARTDGVTE
jgi:hypothetical protein